MDSTNEISPTVSVSWRMNPEGAFANAIREHGVRTVATVCAVSPQTVCNWTSGTPMPDWALVKICGLLSFDVPTVKMRSDAEERAHVRFDSRMVRKTRRRAPAASAAVANA